MNVTLRQLRAFVLVARLGNFTRAAQAMHVTQSALSLLVRELESALKTRLVNRTTRSVSVTEVGAEFLITAQRVLGDLEHALADIDKMLAKERGRVVIVAPLVLSSVLLPPILASFKARYPRVELILRDTLPDQVLPQVASGMADLGIGTFHPTRLDVERLLLFRESLVAVYRRDRPPGRRGASRLTWRDLRDEPVLTLPRGSVFRDLAEAGFDACGIPLEPAMEATYVGTLIGLVRAGVGIAIVPGYATALADTKTLAWQRLERPVIDREVVMVKRTGRTLSPAAEALQAHILQSVGSAQQA